MSSTEEAPFTIAVSDAAITLLKQKLAFATFLEEVEDAGWDYGAPLAGVRRLAERSERWKDGYNWRTHEAQLNSEALQFIRDIEMEGFGTYSVHYPHKKSVVEDAIPLLFVHGWPGGFFEARHILPLLTAVSPQYPTFHVVALSLPGFGYSEAPRKKGFEIEQYAAVGKLMVALGYSSHSRKRLGTWDAESVFEYTSLAIASEILSETDTLLSSQITHTIARIHGPKHSKAMHSNFLLGPEPSPAPDPIMYNAAERAGLERTEWYLTRSSGYLAEQSTQPQTLGYGITYTPIGLLGWLYEKLIVWTNEYPWQDDEILTWMSLYWFSRAGPTAGMRIYREVAQAVPVSKIFHSYATSAIPLGYSNFPKDIVCYPLSWVKTPNLVFHSVHTKGGHFAAYEQPEALVGDLRHMFGRGGVAFGVIPRNIGYA